MSDQQNNSEEIIFKTIEEIYDYLSPKWKGAKSTIYRLINKERKLLPQDDGTFSQKSVDKFAKDWLKEKSTGKKVNEKNDEIQRRKLEEELKNIELKNAREKFNFDKDQGKYIPREQMDIELAGRAGILDAGLKHWVQSRAAEWIRTVGGDPKKIGELINLMNRDIDEHINNYASTREFQVIISGDDEQEDETVETSV